MSISYKAEIVVGFRITKTEFLDIINTEYEDYCISRDGYSLENNEDFIFGEVYYSVDDTIITLPNIWSLPYPLINRIRENYKKATGKVAPFCTPFLMLRVS